MFFMKGIYKIRRMKYVFVLTLLIVLIIQPIQLTASRYRDNVDVVYVGDNTFESTIRVDSGNRLLVIYGWLKDDVRYTLWVITEQTITHKFMTTNTTLEVYVYIYNETGLEDNYNFTYSPDFWNYVLFESIAHIQFFLVGILLIVIVYVVLKLIRRR